MLDFLIVTPSLNGVRFIEQCIESVALAFNGYQYLHLIVDGGSGDGTIEVVQQHERNTLQLLRCPGTSMYEALNKGLNFTQAKVFYQLNVDDLVLPHAPRAIADVLAKDPKIAAVTGASLTVNLDRGLCRIRYPLSDQFETRRIANNLFISQPSTFIRHEVLVREGGYDTQYRYASDTELWLRLMQRNYHLVSSNSCLSIDRLHQGCARFSQKHLNELDAVRVHYLGRKPSKMAILKNSLDFTACQLRHHWRGGDEPGMTFFGSSFARILGFFLSNEAGISLDYPFLSGKFPFWGRLR